MKLFKKVAVCTLLCCLTVALIAACTKDVVETPGSIYGIVNDADNGEPVSGAHVVLNPGGRTTNTGSDGRYEFLDMEAGQYTIQISKTGYKTNTKRISVVAGRQASGDMILEREPQEADIIIEPSTLDFGTTQNELSVSITNRGNTATEWSLNLGDNEWLSASPITGNIGAGKTQSIIFSVNRDKLSEAKDVKISLAAFGNSYTISVSCALQSSKSEMTVTPDILDFGTTEQEKNITIKNTGNSSLTWKISDIIEECISVSESEGKVEPTGEQVVKVLLDRSKQTQDINTSFIISDGIKEQAVIIKATKAAAKMTVSPLSLDFGEEFTEQSFTISNTGSADLVWNITVPEGMGLKVSETSGATAPSASKQIIVTLDRSVMPETLDTSIEVSDGINKEIVSVKGIKGDDIVGTVVPQGLYVYYKFDDNFEDATENEIHGFGTASPSFVEGVTPEGKAVKFSKADNNSFVVAKPIIDNKQMTICFWGKDFDDGHIFHLNSSMNNQTMLSLSMENGALKFVAFSENHGFPDFDRQQTFIHPTLTDGKWHHIALISDNNEHYLKNTTTLYVDGMEVYVLTETAWTSSSYGKGTSFIMGGSLNVNNSTYNQLSATNMSVDNFRVYDNRKLSASEIKEIYNAKQ